MTIPVWVEQQNGKFTASVPGAPQLNASGATRDDVIESVRTQLRSCVSTGQIVLLDIDFVGVSGLAGTYKDDTTILDICDEAYRLRDEEKAVEMAEYDRP